MSTLRYKAITLAKNPEGGLTYSGRTLGVKFDRGIAFFDNITIDSSLGLSAEDIARRMENDFGYRVERMNADGTPWKGEKEYAEAVAREPVLSGIPINTPPKPQPRASRTSKK